MESNNCMPPQEPSGVLSAVISGFIAGVTATIALLAALKKE